MIENADRYEPLRVVSTFWRDGIVSAQDGRYIQAIYSFYFVLEDMFGKNKTDPKQILNFFRQSDALTAPLRFTVSAFPTENHIVMSTLTSVFNELGLKWDVDGLRVFIIKMRGRLHHYKGRSSLRQGTPFTQGRNAARIRWTPRHACASAT